MRYDHQKIERRWRRIWEEKNVFRIRNKEKKRKNFYHLVMFPYPSGDLHIGHWYNFAPADVFARYKRMRGFNVLSPIGFDAFGLPAENAAIKRGIHPKDWTYKNIGTMTAQLKSIGAMYDWSRKVITSDPEYYKWTQWMFLRFYKNGLAYKKRAPANWCPKCRTVLANEQVINGKCERCGSEVVQREIEQWLFKITDYAERLLKDLDKLDWPGKTKAMQRNWIGRSEGAEAEFKIWNLESKIKVFTTRLDTIFGCTYLVAAPEHKIILNLKSQILNLKEVENYIELAKKKSELQRLEIDKQKTGVELKGIKAVNPFNNEKIPIFVADYVLGHYGTGAVMAVPAHDERDWDFAKKYGLPAKIVICPNYPAPVCPVLEKAFTEDAYLVDSGQFTGLKSAEAREKMAGWLEEKNLGGRTVNYKLRDWLVSRQRYWGAPIPIIYCKKCGIAPVPEKDLPVKLPNVKNYLPTEEGQSPLAHSEKFVNAKCPECGGGAKRETDTMDTFVCSSWYYLRYADPKNPKKFADAKKIKAWLPVKMYVGGAEHSVLHLLYARFFTKALRDAGELDFNEPFLALRHQGTVLGADGRKMSKSRGNVVDPDDLVKKYGADAVRTYLCFMGPYEQGGPWNPTGILGAKRFLERVWGLVQNSKAKNRNGGSKLKNDKLERLLNQTAKKVTEDIENFKFNTAVSALMILLNEMEKTDRLPAADCQLFLKLLFPFAPHLSQELWSRLGRKTFLDGEKWPAYDPRLIKEETFTLVVQVNGRVRDSFEAPAGVSQAEAEKLTLGREKVKKWLGGKRARKVVFVPNKLINFVL